MKTYYTPSMFRKKLRLPVGISDFRLVRESGYEFIDKSLFLDEVVQSNAQAILLLRPRRFGKTLNLSMLHYFLEKTSEDRRELFRGLKVEQSEEAMRHFQRYPVLFITLKKLKCSDWEECFRALAGLIAELYEKHRYLLDEGQLSSEQAKIFTAILNKTAASEECSSALRFLSEQVAKYHQSSVVILVDEYDTPLQSAYMYGYYEPAVLFFRNFLSEAFKDNPHLFKGVMTGILRIAKESIFSGLNNLAVHSLLRHAFSTHFGFTEEEVLDLARRSGQETQIEGVRRWYNGYLFGGRVVYNPWSVINFFTYTENGFLPYWAASASNELIHRLLFNRTQDVYQSLETLLQGGTIERPLNENIVFRDLDQNPDALWSFLLFSGYLKVTETFTMGRREWGKLKIPNDEVLSDFEDITRTWLKAQLGGPSQVNGLLQALLQGDALTLQQELSEILKTSMSYYDADRKLPERIYHAFLLGVLVYLEPQYEVRSNRESGFGRYDLMILPKNQGPGVVLEIKALDLDANETVELGLLAGEKQLVGNDYAMELRARKAHPIHQLVIVFSGKRAFVKKLPMN